MGLRPSLANWLCGFLTQRAQRVGYNGTYSDWTVTTCGLPQGTVLGPLIFLAIINSACQDAIASRWKFVDDMNLAESRMIGAASTLQADLDQLTGWTNNRQMKLHPKKCKVMHVSFSKVHVPRPQFSIAGEPLEEVKAVKLLGVHFQEDLGWELHVNHVVKQGNQKLYLLKRLRCFDLSREDLLLCYKTLVRPTCEYAAPAWHAGLTTAQRARIETLQRRACRIILGPAYTSYKEACSILDLPTLDDRRRDLCRNFAKRLVESESFRNWLPPTRGDISSRDTRNKHRLTGIRTKTKRYQNSPIPFMTRLLNETDRILF
ncbi:hypothetical protein Bbelb_065380 [Branchiostoma belcheri]|nr:hypothetical protein Bbelb_065380 [Branchiostoma belcheri]